MSKAKSAATSSLMATQLNAPNLKFRVVNQQRKTFDHRLSVKTPAISVNSPHLPLGITPESKTLCPFKTRQGLSSPPPHRRVRLSSNNFTPANRARVHKPHRTETRPHLWFCSCLAFLLDAAFSLARAFSTVTPFASDTRNPPRQLFLSVSSFTAFPGRDEGEGRRGDAGKRSASIQGRTHTDAIACRARDNSTHHMRPVGLVHERLLQNFRLDKESRLC